MLIIIIHLYLILSYGTYPKLSCRKKNACTGYCLWRVAYKNVCPKTIIHEIPAIAKEEDTTKNLER